MTVRIPKGVLVGGGILVIVGVIVAAFLVGRSSDSHGSKPTGQITDQQQTPCSKSSAKDAILRSDWPYLIETSPFGGGFSPEPFFSRVRGFHLAVLRCAELKSDGTDQMIVALSAGAAGRIFNWAIFGQGAGNWKLEFHQEGIPLDKLSVEGAAVVTQQPVFGPEDPLCCPRSHRRSEIVWTGSGYQVRTEAPSNAREIVANATAGVTRLGALDPRTSTPADAAAAFGAPPAIVQEEVICRQEWRDLGLVISFVDFGGPEPCGPGGRVGSFYVAGSLGQQAGWKAEGLSIGTNEHRVRALFPRAAPESESGERFPPFQFSEPPLLLIERPSPFGQEEKTPVMRAGLQGGKVIALEFSVGASGE